MKRIDTTTISAIAEQIREMLGEDFDDQTFWDSLDGETDAGDILDHLIWQAQSTQTLIDSIREHEMALRHRKQRLEARVSAAKSAMLTVIDAAGVKKAERPCATITRRNGSASVVITDEDALPSQLCAIKKVPDKKAIKQQLDAGETVPGAEIKIGDDGVTMRTA